MNEVDYYDVKKVSASSLAWFEKSPLYFRMMLDKEIDEETKHYYVQGDKIHKFILEPENYKYTVLDYDTPAGKQKQFIDKVAAYKKAELTDNKVLQAYKEVYVAKGKDEELLNKANELLDKYANYVKYNRIKYIYDFIWTTKENEYMESLKSQVYNHKKASELLNGYPSEIFTDVIQGNEFEIYWVHDKTGVECKSKLDRMIIDTANKVVQLVDLKTTSSLHDFDTHSFMKFKYYRQMAFYLSAIDWYIEHELNDDPSKYTKEVYIVAIGKQEPVEVRVFKVSDKLILEGMREIDELMEKIKWHTDNELWQYPKEYYDSDGVILIEDESTDS